MNSKIIRWSIIVFLALQLPRHWQATSVDLLTQSVVKAQRTEAQKQVASDEDRGLPPNSWRGLIPLRSSRADVESILGKAKTSRGLTYVYETENERVDVLYSAGPCKLSAVERWNVALDIVLRIDVRPHAKILIQALHLDKARYPRLQEAHPENWARYMNDEDGIMVETISYGKDEEVYTITYWPRSVDKPLHCSDTDAYSRSKRRQDCERRKIKP